MIEDLIQTPEQIAKHYSACLDSVNLINKLLKITNRTENDNIIIARNVEHLKIMLTKDFWTTEDLTPLYDSITTGN